MPKYYFKIPESLIDKDNIIEELLSDRSVLRNYLRALRSQEVKKLKLDDPQKYREYLANIVGDLFFQGMRLEIRKGPDGQPDYEHFVKDRLREDYIHTLKTTIQDGDIYISFEKDGAQKAYCIKKYCDPEVRRDIWDMVVIYNNKIQTKFSRKGMKGQGYAENIIQGAGNEASRSATPPRTLENASPGNGNTEKKITPQTAKVKTPPRGGHSL